MRIVYGKTTHVCKRDFVRKSRKYILYILLMIDEIFEVQN